MQPEPIKTNREAVQRLSMIAVTIFRGISLEGILKACEKALPALPEATQTIVKEDIRLLTAALPLWQMGEEFAKALESKEVDGPEKQG